MSSDIPPKVLDDLCSRFIINIPLERRDDLVQILFAVESAHWFYIDVYCEDDHELNPCNIKDFAQQIFQHCPFLRNYQNNLEEIFSRWRDYKYSVPTYGAILLDPNYEHILLVQGFYNRESWGFPKGKVQENESPIKCAIREVMEEIGFDMKDRAFEDQFIEREFNGQIVRLYIVKQVPLETKFAPKTKNEIKEMRWFPIADIPCHSRELNAHLNPKAFFMVIPFVKDLRRWIKQQQQQQQNVQRHRTLTYHGNIPLPNKYQRQISQNSFNEIFPMEYNENHLISTSRHRCYTDGNLSKNVFQFNGPKCWTQFRLNRLEISRCLYEI